MDLFTDSGASFSSCRRYRFALWRLWDKSKPLVMFIGLNPSTANETEPDATIKSVIRISKNNGFGGVYMMNCFPFVSTDPDGLNYHGFKDANDEWLRKIAGMCSVIVFACGSFKVVVETGRDKDLIRMFPDAYCLGMNSSGSPKHPLYIKAKTILTPFILK